MKMKTKISKAKKSSLPRSEYNYQDTYQELYNLIYQDALLEQNISDKRIEELIVWHINKYQQKHVLPLSDLEKLKSSIFNKLRRLDILQPLLEDENITEIMVNGPYKIFYEKAGKIYLSDLRFSSQEELNNIIIAFFSRHNINLSISKPTANLRLEDGSRAHAVIAPATPDGPILTIRKFNGISADINSLISTGFMDQKQANYLNKAVVNKQSIMIGGGTDTGKTTLLNTLSAFIPKNERIVTIEDSPELQLQDKDNWVRLVCHEDNLNPTNNIDMNYLIKESLRMRPDRIVIGEVRGKEAYDMLKATQTGHPGTLCTIHANDCFNMIYRLADLILDSSALPYSSILSHIYTAIDILVHIKRNQDGERFIDEIAEISNEKGKLNYRNIFRSTYE